MLKHRLALALSLFVPLVACGTDDSSAPDQTIASAGLTQLGNKPDPDRVIVAFQPGQAAAGRAAVQAAGGGPMLDIRGLDAVAVSLPAQARTALAHHAAVAYIEPDVVRYALSTGGTGESVPYGISLVQADQVQPGPYPRTVCIIDSGYSFQHEDLKHSGVSGSNDSGTGAWDFDDNGHGTHVAGTISAIGGNGVGVRGVIADGSVNLYIVKVFTAAGWAYSSSLANAAQDCADHGANVISMSLGGGSKSRTEDRKFGDLDKAGILSIAAAGNDGNNRMSYPASYSSVLSVAALDKNKQVASFSQYNSQVEIAAPGVGVLSTTPWLAEATVSVGGTSVDGHTIENAIVGTATGPLADGGLCDSVGSWAGQVVLCQRGNISFYDKVTNATSGGAVAVVIYNNVEGPLSATLGDGNTSTVPAMAVSDTDGAALLPFVGQDTTVATSFTFPASGYEAWDGTSMATPHVSGVAALVWSHNASWTNQQIREALDQSAEDLGAAGRDNNYGYGLVQTAAALAYLGDAGGGGSTNLPPVASFTFSCVDLTCSFDGSASADPDGTIASYSWSFGAAGPTASTTFGAGGSYTVTLTVTDDQGSTSSSSQTVSVTDPNAPELLITNVGASSAAHGPSFTISWSTNVASNSAVTFTCCGTYTDSAMVTSHAMSFNGQKGTTYEYTVSSTDANGTTVTSGPYTFTK